MKKRVVSALILLLIFIPLAYYGGNIFLCGIVGIAVLSMYELLSLRKEKKQIPLFTQMFAYIVIIYLVANQAQSAVLTLNLDYRVISSLVFVFFLPIVITANNKKYNLNDAFFLFGSTILLGLSFNLLILIRNYSPMIFAFMFIITIVTDTFAYISGSLVGRHPLSLEISPKKTIEGLVGGTIMGVIVSSIFYLEVINPSIPIWLLLIVTISLSLIGQLGDLVFSQIKRYYNKKDFSNLVPGHGGILDRLDSIIFVCLAIVFFISII